jgi:hypothetical protein
MKTADQPSGLTMRVSEVSIGRFKTFIVLENHSDHMRMECDANQHPNSWLYLQSSQIQSPNVQVTFTCGDKRGDFYCEGLQDLCGGLQVGDEVNIFFNLSREQEEKEGKKYETLKISDITFKLKDGQQRHYSRAGVGGGDFTATRLQPDK